ncbi:uncharacterized protein J3D65DRAFT_663652 [Phyllosticta citribraziliensis]|uniref:LYR motif-containing protein 2 n=1 Tax=Phyllosticta citribraziliensis TaxID=989973 RepID=A0ABR1MAA6_9PEZI
MITRSFNAIRLQSRSYASVSSKLPKPGKGPFLSLDQFLQRQRVISFWREIVRALHSQPNPVALLKEAHVSFNPEIPPSPTRDELRQYARTEFERHKHVTDLTHIRYLLSNGKTEFDMMKRYINEQAR